MSNSNIRREIERRDAAINRMLKVRKLIDHEQDVLDLRRKQTDGMVFFEFAKSLLVRLQMLRRKLALLNKHPDGSKNTTEANQQYMRRIRTVEHAHAIAATVFEVCFSMQM